MHYRIRAQRLRWRHDISRIAIVLLIAALPYATWATPAPSTLNLARATELTLQHNPELKVFHWRLQAIAASRQTANQTPGYEVALEAENALGSGSYSGMDQAELTVSLSSLFEFGGKRKSRVAVADARSALAQVEEQAIALNTFGQVTQQFITALTLQEKLSVVKEAVALAELTHQLVQRRTERGAAPEAERLRAKAALKMARLQQNALASQLQSSKLALASFWGANQVTFERLNGELFRFEDADSFDALYQRVANNPELQVFASEQRLREAEVSLVRSQSASDLRWRLGVKHARGSGDSALTAGVSIPLFADKRNRGKVGSARAKSKAARFRQQSALLRIRARLFEAWQNYRHSSEAATQMRSEVVPVLEQALLQTRQGYQQGRYGYIDWVTAQRELLEARTAAIDAAGDALLNQALIEQLTAEPLSSSHY